MTTFDAKPYLKALGQRIRELRAAQGYSQEAFADKCGVHRTFMGTVERGESNLSFQNIQRVAYHLSVSLSDLFCNLEEKSQAYVEEPKPASGTANRESRTRPEEKSARKRPPQVP